MNLKIFTCVIFLCQSSIISNGAIIIPQDASTIQEGINLAQNYDTVIILPGVYYESLLIDSKSITLSSSFIFSNDTSFINNTVINALGNNYVIKILNSTVDSTKIIGLTIQNANDGIATSYSKTIISNNKIINCVDGIDYGSGSKSRCSHNLFENNDDDGIDLDGGSEVHINTNIIRNNNDDGIEIRLHTYSGPLLTTVIIDNEIYGNLEDGIQLIDYNDTSSREFRIERNLIYGNAMVGIGCMANGNTHENFEGAPIAEEILVINNTFSNQMYHITGGANLASVNNIYHQASVMGTKNVDQNSIVSYCDFGDNLLNYINSNVDTATTVFASPLLDSTLNLMFGSPCINAAIDTFLFNGDTVLYLIPWQYSGYAPDIGAKEYDCYMPAFNDTIEICQGDSVYLQNAWRKDPGIFYDSLLNVYGCDSIVITDLVVNPTYFSIETYAICEGDSLFWQGSFYTTPGEYAVIYQTVQNCDSIFELILIVNPTYFFLEFEEICEGDSVFWQGAYYNATGQYTAGYQTIHNCDSVFELNLLVHPTPQPFSISGQDTVILNQTEIYFTPENPDVTYSWNVVNGTIISYISNDSIEVQWPNVGTGFIYSVAETLFGCLGDTASLEIVIGTVGFSSGIQGKAIKVYPDPARDQITVTGYSFTNASIIMILDNLGRLMKTVRSAPGTERAMIDIRELANGLYIIRINDQHTVRFIKQ